MWTHLSPLVAFFVIGPFAALAPWVMWMAKKDSSAFIDDQGREVLNMSLTGVVLLLIGGMTGIFVLVWFVWAIIALIGVIRGAAATSNGEYFRYPMTIRFLN